MSTTAEQFWRSSEAKHFNQQFSSGQTNGELLAVILEFATAYAHSRITSLAEEAGREADALREKTKSYTASEQAKTLIAMEYWLRQKAEGR